MAIPEPVTPPSRDLGRRTQTAFDLELTLVGFLRNLFADHRDLDNPTVNLAQPDVVPFDFTERAQTLEQKLVPRVERGRIPRTLTGEIALDKLADVPNIIVQAIKAKVEITETIATVRILFSAYDENPNSQGYQDVLNMIETTARELTSYGQQAIDKAYPIVMPIEWQMIEADCFPHFVGEMTTTWELPSARPLPDADVFGIIPAEHIDVRFPLFEGEDPDQPPIDQPPVEPKPDEFVATFTPSKVVPTSDLFLIGGLYNGNEIRFESTTPLPQPLVAGQYYFVVNATDAQFQISQDRNGAVLDIETSGSGQNDIWRKVP